MWAVDTYRLPALFWSYCERLRQCKLLSRICQSLLSIVGEHIKLPCSDSVNQYGAPSLKVHFLFVHFLRCVHLHSKLIWSPTCRFDLFLSTFGRIIFFKYPSMMLMFFFCCYRPDSNPNLYNDWCITSGLRIVTSMNGIDLLSACPWSESQLLRPYITKAWNLI